MAEPLAIRCEQHYEAWSADTPQSEGRVELRSEVFAFARSSGAEQQRRLLVQLASQIGTP